MNKRIIPIIGGAAFLLALTFILILAYDIRLNQEENSNNPNYISSYLDKGYYRIDPETILMSLENGDANVFMPLPQDPQNITEDVTDINISWTQADFLEIANALSRLVWNDPMDSRDWHIHFISFGGSCNNSIGFFSATITYFKTGSKGYTTRLIEIQPYLGWARWGDEETYPKPILQKWDSVDLPGAKISADDALRIASKDVKERFQLKDNCGGLVSTPQNDDSENWYVKFIGTPDFVTYSVNLDTGHFTFHKANE